MGFYLHGCGCTEFPGKYYALDDILLSSVLVLELGGLNLGGSDVGEAGDQGIVKVDALQENILVHALVVVVEQQGCVLEVRDAQGGDANLAKVARVGGSWKRQEKESKLDQKKNLDSCSKGCGQKKKKRPHELYLGRSQSRSRRPCPCRHH